MCCFSCCEDCCESCSCSSCPDFDEIKESLSEMKQDYEITVTQMFSRCGERCVSPRNNHILMCTLFLFEMGVFIIICIVLDMIIYKPNFEFDSSLLEIIQWNNTCNVSKDSLTTAYEHSKLLMPLHATLLTLSAFFLCFFCKPPKGPVIGCVCRYPFAICCLVYSWIMYYTYNTIQNENCILGGPEEVSDRIDELATFSLNLSLYYTILIGCMFPTISGAYLIIYYTLKLCNLAFNRCFGYYLDCISHISCCTCMYMVLTCSCLQRRRLPSQNQTKNWTPDQRKQLVQITRGTCPLCFVEEVDMVTIRGCQHGCCTECLHRYLLADLKNTSSYPRRCWYPNCQTLIAYHEVEYVLTAEELATYDQMLIKSSVNNTEQITCPSCGAVMLKSHDRARLMQCANTNCRADLCSSCGVLWHSNQTCEEFQKRMTDRTGEADAAFNELVKKQKWRPCPRCGVVVERSEGCYHMTHIACEKGDLHRTDFCYFCGEELTKKDGEGWRYSKITDEKHFPDGVYSKCIKADQLEESILGRENSHTLRIGIL